MATFDSGRQRYSMNFYASHQRPLQRRSYTGRPSRPAEGQLRGSKAVILKVGNDFRSSPNNGHAMDCTGCPFGAIFGLVHAPRHTA